MPPSIQQALGSRLNEQFRVVGAVESFLFSPIPDISLGLVPVYLKFLKAGKQNIRFSFARIIERKKRGHGITFGIEMTY